MFFRFGEFELDESTSRLSRAGEPVTVQPQPLELLLLLLRRHPAALTKEEIVSALWPSTGVTEYSLTGAVRALRRALGEHAGEERVIRTVRGRGYAIGVPIDRSNAPLGETPPAREAVPPFERHLSAILSADAVGYSRLMGTDDFATVERLSAYRQVMAETVSGHGGRVVGAPGDNLLAEFPSAVSALASALAIQRALEEKNAPLVEAERLRFRIGLHLGEVLVDGDQIHGDAVNVAARLEQLAAPGGLCASGVVIDETRGKLDVAWEEVGEAALKNIARAIRVHRVGGALALSQGAAWNGLPSANATPAVERVPLPSRLATATAFPLVGRTAEQARIADCWIRIREGQRQVVLVAGEPGIGKTRVAAEAALAAYADGATVLLGTCDEDLGVPYRPFIEALRHYVAHAPEGVLAAHVREHKGELGRLVPELGRRVPSLPAPQLAQPETERYLLFEAVTGLLTAASQERPLVLVLDDLHWAGTGELVLLKHLVRSSAPMRLLVIGAYRDTDVTRTHALTSVLADLRQEAGVERVPLGGLDDAAVEAMVEAAAGHALTDAGVALARALQHETEGNPFFVSEMLRHLAESGTAFRLDGPGTSTPDVRDLGLPESVREAIGRRVGRLSPAAREVLGLAAVIGRQFDLALLARVAERSEDAVLDALDEAIGAALVAEVGDGAGQFQFTHVLVRTTLYEEHSATRTRRARLHRKVGEALETLVGTDPEGRLDELVYHWHAAAPVADPRKAIAYGRRAGDRALANLAFEAAAAHYEVALDVGEPCGALDTVEAIELRLALARALRLSGDVRGARARCREVAVACREANRPDLLGRAALIHAGPVGDFYSTDPEARAFLEEACRVAGTLDDSLQARLYGRLAGDIIAANEIEQMHRAAVLGDQAASAARRAGDAGALALALLAGFFLAGLGTRPPADAAHIVVPPTLPTLKEILETAESAGELEFAAEIRYTRAAMMFAMGESEGYWAELDALAAVAAASRVPEALWLADALAAMRATVEGRFAEGRRLNDQALATGLRMQIANAAGVHIVQQVMWHAAQGRVAELLPLLSDFVDRHPRVAVWRSFLALARLAGGDEVGARAEFRRLVAAGFTPAKRGVNLRIYLAALAALCVGLGDREQAPVLYKLVARRPETWVIDGCATFGPWALALGSLALLCGRPAEAATHFEEAIHLGRRMRSGPVVAQAQSRLAAVWLSVDPDADRRARAIEALAEAERTARELGIVDVLERAERLRTKLHCGG